MDEARIRVRFVGHVQGVGLRGTLSKYCLKRQVTGWMCNTADHEVVLAELQGSKVSIDAALRSVAAYFSDPSRCRGMSIEHMAELPCVEGERGMCEIPWSELSSKN